MSDTAWLRLRGLSKVYKEAGRVRPVLSNLDFDMKRGECVALVGRSGCGKSTLLNLIAGIDRPSAGAITVAGTSLDELDERRRSLFRRRHIGFVFQFFNLIPTLTVRENLLLPLELCGLCDDAGCARANELLGVIGLAGRDDSYPEQLSGGEQQRLAVARAVVHRPALLLADEPTGNLDSETAQAVMSLLMGLVREQGLSLLLVTHSAELASVADRVLVMREGGLREAPR